MKHASDEENKNLQKLKHLPEKKNKKRETTGTGFYDDPHFIAMLNNEEVVDSTNILSPPDKSSQPPPKVRHSVDFAILRPSEEQPSTNLTKQISTSPFTLNLMPSEKQRIRRDAKIEEKAGVAASLMEKELKQNQTKSYECLDSETSLIIPFQWGDSTIDKDDDPIVIEKHLLDRKITGSKLGVTHKSVLIWEKDDDLPVEVGELSGQMKRVFGWNDELVQRLEEPGWEAKHLRVTEEARNLLFNQPKLWFYHRSKGPSSLPCKLKNITLHLYPLGVGVMIYRVDWRPEEHSLSIDELRSRLFLVRFLYKMKGVFLGWSISDFWKKHTDEVDNASSILSSRLGSDSESMYEDLDIDSSSSEESTSSSSQNSEELEEMKYLKTYKQFQTLENQHDPHLTDHIEEETLATRQEKKEELKDKTSEYSEKEETGEIIEILPRQRTFKRLYNIILSFADENLADTESPEEDPKKKPFLMPFFQHKTVNQEQVVKKEKWRKHIQSLGRLASAIYAGKLLSLNAISNWLVHLPQLEEEAWNPPVRIGQTQTAFIHTSVCIDSKPEMELLGEYLFHLRHGYAQRTRPSWPFSLINKLRQDVKDIDPKENLINNKDIPLYSSAMLAEFEMSENMKKDRIICQRQNRFIGICDAGSVSISWPMLQENGEYDPWSERFERIRWPHRYHGIYALLSMHVLSEVAVLTQLSRTAILSMENFQRVGSMDLEELNYLRQKLRDVVSLMVTYTFTMTNTDCGGERDYSIFFGHVCDVSGVDVYQMSVRKKLRDVLSVVESSHSEEIRRQQERMMIETKLKEKIQKAQQNLKFRQTTRMEMLISILGAFGIPIVIIAGLWGMNNDDLPRDWPFWALFGAGFGISVILLLGICLFRIISGCFDSFLYNRKVRKYRRKTKEYLNDVENFARLRETDIIPPPIKPSFYDIELKQRRTSRSRNSSSSSSSSQSSVCSFEGDV